MLLLGWPDPPKSCKIITKTETQNDPFSYYTIKDFWSPVTFRHKEIKWNQLWGMKNRWKCWSRLNCKGAWEHTRGEPCNDSFPGWSQDSEASNPKCEAFRLVEMLRLLENTDAKVDNVINSTQVQLFHAVIVDLQSCAKPKTSSWEEGFVFPCWIILVLSSFFQKAKTLSC